MLVRSRKFDIRQLVLVTPQGQVFMYRDSYVRTCSKAFSLGDDDLSVHLTNDAVQKNLDSYGQFEDANKLAFAEFDVRPTHPYVAAPPSPPVYVSALLLLPLLQQLPLMLFVLPLPFCACRRF